MVLCPSRVLLLFLSQEKKWCILFHHKGQAMMMMITTSSTRERNTARQFLSFSSYFYFLLYLFENTFPEGKAKKEANQVSSDCNIPSFMQLNPLGSFKEKKIDTKIEIILHQKNQCTLLPDPSACMYNICNISNIAMEINITIEFCFVLELWRRSAIVFA